MASKQKIQKKDLAVMLAYKNDDGINTQIGKYNTIIARWRHAHAGEHLQFNNLNLQSADLRHADLGMVQLTNADLRGADFCGTDMRKTSLFAVDLDGAKYDKTTKLPEYLMPDKLGMVDVSEIGVPQDEVLDPDIKAKTKINQSVTK